MTEFKFLGELCSSCWGKNSSVILWSVSSDVKITENPNFVKLKLCTENGTDVLHVNVNLWSPVIHRGTERAFDLVCFLSRSRCTSAWGTDRPGSWCRSPAIWMTSSWCGSKRQRRPTGSSRSGSTTADISTARCRHRRCNTKKRCLMCEESDRKEQCCGPDHCQRVRISVIRVKTRSRARARLTLELDSETTGHVTTAQPRSVLSCCGSNKRILNTVLAAQTTSY